MGKKNPSKEKQNKAIAKKTEKSAYRKEVDAFENTPKSVRRRGAMG